MYLNYSAVQSILKEFEKKKVLVIGDIMLDSYWYGQMNRISPEAPVPVILIEKKENRPGGAANVALNLARMGSDVRLVSMTGNDKEAKILSQLLIESGISSHYLYSSPYRPTTVKSRVIANYQQQSLRLDVESTVPANENETRELIKLFDEAINATDVIIFEDYDKGVLNQAVIDHVIQLALKKNIPTLVDPKIRNFNHYHHITLFKPNLKELTDGTGCTIQKPILQDQLYNVCRDFIREKNHHSLMVTLSAEGIFITDGSEHYHIPSHKRNVYDVSGAGDTVAAIAALSMACQLSLPQIAELSNLAGGLVCEYVGVVPVEKEWILNEYRKWDL